MKGKSMLPLFIGEALLFLDKLECYGENGVILDFLGPSEALLVSMFCLTTPNESFWSPVSIIGGSVFFLVTILELDLPSTGSYDLEF